MRGPPAHIPRVDARPSADLTAATEIVAPRLLLAGVAIAAFGGALASVAYRAFDLDRFFVPKELALHVGAAMIMVALLQRAGPRPRTRIDLTLGAWLLLSVASTLAATSGWHAIRALAISASAAAMFWGAVTLREAGRARAVVGILALSATLAAATSLAQAYGVESDFFSANRAPGGTLGNRNFVAHVAAMAVPMLIWLTATARTFTGAVLPAVGVLVCAAALVLSRTRAAWLAIALTTVVLVPILLRYRGTVRAATEPRRGRMLMVAVAIGLTGALAIPNTLDWASDSPYLDSVRDVVNYREGSGAGRLKQYLNSLEMVRAHPVLGVGPGNWAAEYPRFADRNDPSLSDATGMASNPWPSSDWVAALAERGVPATLALVAFTLLLLMNAWRGWRDAVYPSAERFGALAGGAVLLIGAAEGMFDAVTLLAFPSVVLLGAAGALIPPGAGVGNESPARRYALPGLLLAWAAIIAGSALKIDAMRLYSTGTLAGVRGAAARDPGSYRIQMRAAELLAGRGDCRTAYHHASRARDLFPVAQGPRAILNRCAGPTPSRTP